MNREIDPKCQLPRLIARPVLRTAAFGPFTAGEASRPVVVQNADDLGMKWALDTTAWGMYHLRRACTEIVNRVA